MAAQDEGSDSDSDSDKEDAPEKAENLLEQIRRLGLETDWAAEMEKAKVPVTERMSKWTNAVDTAVDWEYESEEEYEISCSATISSLGD